MKYFFKKALQIIWKLFPNNIKIFLVEQKIYGKLDFNEGKIFLLLTSSISKRRLNSCKKEPGTISWIKENVNKCENFIFYDIGANTGSYSFVAASLKTGSNSKVYAFEAVPGTFMELCENIVLNKFENTIYPLNLTLSDKSEITTFGINGFDNGIGMHMGISNKNMSTNSDSSVFNYPIKTFTLDEVVEMFNIPFPDFLKIDVDGPEYEILKGANKILSNSKLKSLQIEIDVSNQPVSELVAYLERCGLKIRQKNKHEVDQIYDFIFTRE
jgi:FkbM family methyltransferase